MKEQGRRRDKTPVTSMRVRYVFVLGLLALLSLAEHLILIAQIRASETGAAVVNVSGRQRMLSQRTALLAQHLVSTMDQAERMDVREKLLGAASLMQQSHDGLLRGEPSLNLPGHPSPQVRALYFDSPQPLDARVRGYLAAIQALARAPDAELTLDNPHLHHIQSVALEETLLNTLDAVVRQYQEEIEFRIMRLQRLQRWGYAIILLVLVAMGLWVFRPMARQIQQEMDALERERARLATEVTERKRAEEALRMARDELEVRVRERTAELREANVTLEAEVIERNRTGNQLKQAHTDLQRALQELRVTQSQLIQAAKLSAVGQLAGGVAHEVKNPLSIILQAIESLEESDRGKRLDPATRREFFEMIYESIDQADKVVRGLLDFSRPTKSELKQSAVRQMLDEALGLIAQQLAQARVEVTKEISQDLPMVLVDRDQIKQVFVNLILNALHAMPKGGRLSVRAYSRALDETDAGTGNRATDVFQPGQAVVFCEIEDTGIGIPEEHLSKVFDPFFTTKGPDVGTGLGLSVVRSIIDAHRGLIGIESEEGHGTKVTVTLPSVGSDVHVA